MSLQKSVLNRFLMVMTLEGLQESDSGDNVGEIWEKVIEMRGLQEGTRSLRVLTVNSWAIWIERNT